MMSTVFVIAAVLLVVANCEKINAAEHAALMVIFNGLGCNETVCPRFAVSDHCVGSEIVCTGGSVTEM